MYFCVSWAVCLPVSTDQSLTQLSVPPVAMVLPSGDHARFLICSFSFPLPPLKPASLLPAATFHRSI